MDETNNKATQSLVDFLVSLCSRGYAVLVVNRRDTGFILHLGLETSPRKGRTMKRTIRTEEQIIGILQEHEAGAKCADLCRKHGMSEGTFYAWKAKYSGMTVSEAKRLKALEDENAKLKKLLAEQMLDMAAMKELLSKKW